MISFDCRCGRRLQVQDDWAGRKVRCPVCQAVVRAEPGPEPQAAPDLPPVEGQATLSTSHDQTMKPQGPPKK